ncbi:MAG: hypothetical protein NC117_04605 [Pseudoflavonifractor sp.]|nr:hypothetical protein [Pseudoflavonifractor sp.]
MWWQWIIYVGVGIVIGAIAASIASDDSRGCLMDIVIGVAGAVVGGALFSLLIKGAFAMIGIFGAIIVGVLFLLALKLYFHYRQWKRSRRITYRQ